MFSQGLYLRTDDSLCRAMSSARANGGNRDRNGHVLVWEQPGLEEAERPPQKQAGIYTTKYLPIYGALRSLVSTTRFLILDNSLSLSPPLSFLATKKVAAAAWCSRIALRIPRAFLESNFHIRAQFIAGISISRARHARWLASSCLRPRSHSRYAGSTKL